MHPSPTPSNPRPFNFGFQFSLARVVQKRGFPVDRFERAHNAKGVQVYILLDQLRRRTACTLGINSIHIISTILYVYLNGRPVSYLVLSVLLSSQIRPYHQYCLCRSTGNDAKTKQCTYHQYVGDKAADHLLYAWTTTNL
jgi:hypothetical protein